MQQTTSSHLQEEALGSFSDESSWSATESTCEMALDPESHTNAVCDPIADVSKQPVYHREGSTGSLADESSWSALADPNWRMKHVSNTCKSIPKETLQRYEEPSKTISDRSSSSFYDSEYGSKVERRGTIQYSRIVHLALGIVALVIVCVGAYLFLDSQGFTFKNNQEPSTVMTMEELSLHDSPSDCYLAIHGEVFDLTTYAPNHPGGPEYVTDFCGKNATRDYLIEHPVSLLKTVSDLKVGVMVIPTQSPTSSPTFSPTSTLLPNTGSSGAPITISPTRMPPAGPSPAPGPTTVSLTSAPSTVWDKFLAEYENKTVTNSSSTATLPPTDSPELRATTTPSWAPTTKPTTKPAMAPAASRSPTPGPTTAFTKQPAPMPSFRPTTAITKQTTSLPSFQLTYLPTDPPSPQPMTTTTKSPTVQPSRQPMPTVSPTDPMLCYSPTEVALHNMREDCWYILYGRVWDFTSYIDVHPGGSRRFFSYCGTDATVPYEEWDKHDERLLAEKVPELEIGTVCDPPSPQPTTQPTRSPTPQPSRQPTLQPTVSPTDSMLCYSPTEVALHNLREDCWYILYGRVWDFTSYIDVHPGGSRRFFSYCGTDATVPYEEWDKHDERLLADKVPELEIGKVCS